MPYSRFEAAAILADYSTDTRYEHGLELAGILATSTAIKPDQAIQTAHQETAVRRLPLEGWLPQDHVAEHIETRVRLQESFERYRTVARFASLPVVQAMPIGPLGRRRSGFHSRAFTIHTPEGDRAILKIPQKDQEYRYAGLRPPKLTLADKVEFVEERIRLLKDIPVANSEKAVAANYGGAIVSSFVSGKKIDSLGMKERAKITDGHLLQGIHDVDTIARAGVLLDDNGTNTTYDSDKGFGFFDHLAANDNERYCLHSNIQALGKMLAQEQRIRFRAKATSIQIRRQLFERYVGLGGDPSLPTDTAGILATLEYQKYWD